MEVKYEEKYLFGHDTVSRKGAGWNPDGVNFHHKNKQVNQESEDMEMEKDVLKSGETAVTEGAGTNVVAEAVKTHLVFGAVDEGKKCPGIDVVNEIGREYFQKAVHKSLFSLIYQTQLERENGVPYPDKFSYPGTVEDFCFTLKNRFCRHLIYELILRGFKDTRALRISPHYQEYHVIAKTAGNKALCIVTNDNAYDGMSWLETVDIETLKFYRHLTPITLMQLAKELNITIGL